MKGSVASHLFAAVDRISRRAAAFRQGVVVRECLGGGGGGDGATGVGVGGWLRHTPGDPPAAFASTAGSKVVWVATEPHAAPVDARAVESARAAFLELGCERVFAWLSPMAWSESADAALRSAGATRVPHVRYYLLAREVGARVADSAPASPTKACDFSIRRLDAEESMRVMDEVAPWYSQSGAVAAKRQVAAGREVLELHAAFDAGQPAKPVAVAGLITMGDVAYFGWAGTDPAYRGRGAQSALIAARLARATELGLRWCASETNTAVDTSLRNLLRAGFGVAGEWAVYEWNLAVPR